MRYTIEIPGLSLFQGNTGEPGWARDIQPDDIQRIAARAEAAGFSFLSIPWHMAMPNDGYGANMGARWPHSLAAAGLLLGATRTITVAPLIVTPCHNTIELAKALSTLDWMSGGRCLPVVMAGYTEWEFRLLGGDFANRNDVTDEQVEAMQALWSQDNPRYEGRFVKVPDLLFEPKPRQRGMPIWFGGKAKRALRRMARYGEGWLSYATNVEDVPAAVDYIRAQPGVGDKPLDIFCYFANPTHDPVSHAQDKPPEFPVGDAAILDRAHYLAEHRVNVTRAPIRSYAERGQLKPARSIEEHLDRIDWFGQEIIPKTRDLGDPPGIAGPRP